jgi:4-nitrophenyl phosphatase
MTNLLSTTHSLSTYRYAIVDVDGVLRRSRQSLPGAAEFLPWLTQHGMDYRIVTNNAMPTLSQLCATFAGMDIPTDEQHVISSASGTAWYLKRLAPAGGRVYVIGEEGIRQAVLGDGLFTFDDQKADFVVVANDRSFTYEKLSRACTLIRNGAHFIATNTDGTYPMENGVIPGAGAIVAAVQTCAAVTPVVVGKPEPILLDMAIDQMGAKREETICLGDRLDTDMAGAIAAGLASIMVTTGVNGRKDVESSPFKPTFIFDGLPELMAAWGTALQR